MAARKKDRRTSRTNWRASRKSPPEINWPAYNKALVARGDITVWIPADEAASVWRAPPTGRRGAPPVYSDAAIDLLSVLRFVYRLPLRATQGFAESLFREWGLDLPVPNYSTICRRTGRLSATVRRKLLAKGPKDIAVDSTGLKVFGEGEWKVRKHGNDKRRTWMKFHVATDSSNSQIESCALTDRDTHDTRVFGGLLDGVAGGISRVCGDGAYDSSACYREAESRGAKLVVPPRRGSVVGGGRRGRDPPGARDAHVEEIGRVGRKKWKERHGYHRRSLSETAMHRYKTVLGDRMSSRAFARQRVEARIKCEILNRMPVPAALNRRPAAAGF